VGSYGLKEEGKEKIHFWVYDRSKCQRFDTQEKKQKHWKLLRSIEIGDVD